MTTEDLLRDALRSRAEGARHLPTAVTTVAARARRHQRRTRAAVSVAAVAAVTAIAVPVALLLGGDPANRSEVPPADAPTVSLGTLGDLPAGPPPTVDYVRDRTYVFSSGETLELPALLIDAAPYLGGVLAVTAELGDGSVTPTLTLLDRDGSTRWTRCGSEVVVSADGTTTGFGWLDGGCDQAWDEPRIEWGPAYAEGSSREVALASGERVSPVAVAEDGLVFGVNGATQDPGRVDVAGQSADVVTVPGLVFATDADLDAGLVAGCTADDGCGLYDESGAVVLPFDDSAESPVAFSPDGRFVVTATVGEENETVQLVRAVADGRVVLTMTAADGFRGSLAWEDGEHLLFARVDRSGEALVRLGLDGSLETATPVSAPTLGGYLLPTS